MAQAFDGIKVIDFSQVLAAPFAATQLALLGADVIKIEPPGIGDQMRNRMLPSPLAEHDMASAFLAMNIGKRSLALDLKDPRGKEIAFKLIETADVVLHNFRGGVVDRLGLDYAAVKAVNPKIVYCAVTGFGGEGPKARDAAYDGAVQAASGMMANNGSIDSGPMRTGYFPVDMMTAISAAYAIAGALFRRERTGEGQYLDVAMLDAALTLQASGFGQYLVDGNMGGLFGNSSATKMPTADCFQTGDGAVLMSATQQNHAAGIFSEIGQPELIDDARFSSIAARIENRAELRALLSEAFKKDSAENWEVRLAAHGVPIAKVRSVAEASETPQLTHRGVLQKVPTPTGMDLDLTLVGSAFTADSDGPAASGPPPLLAEHSAEILTALGYDGSAVDALVADGVVGLVKA